MNASFEFGVGPRRDESELENEFGELAREEELGRRRSFRRNGARPLPLLPVGPRFRLRKPTIQSGWSVEWPLTDDASADSSAPLASGEHARWTQSCLNQVLGLRLRITGIMDAATRSAVRRFQRQQGLRVNGIVGPPTQSALAAACEQAEGLSGNSFPPGAGEFSAGETEAEGQGGVDRRSPQYMRWIQAALNRILGSRLALDGLIGPQTRSAIRRFQQRQSLAADGIVGQRTESALIAAGAGQPPGRETTPRLSSRTVDTPLPSPGPGYYSYKPQAQQYALASTVRALQTIGAAWQRAHQQGPRIGFGDISLRGGGPMRGHLSHQLGVDVDIRLMRNDGQETGTLYQSAQYARALTQELVHLIRANGVLPVRYIFFNDAAVTGVSKWPNHDDHLHVRFSAPSSRADDIAREYDKRRCESEFGGLAQVGTRGLRTASAGCGCSCPNCRFGKRAQPVGRG